MTYTMARFGPPETEKQKSLVELIQDTAGTVLIASNLAEFVERKRKEKAAAARAKAAVKVLIEQLSVVAEAEKVDTSVSSFFMKALRKIFMFVGRKLFTYIVRPIFNFAMRMSMAVVRFVLNTVVRLVIVPLIQVVVGFIAANPITAIVLGVIAAGGGLYWMWNKFFREETQAPAIPADDIKEGQQAVRGDPTDAIVQPVAQGKTAVQPVAPIAPAETPGKSFMDYVEAPIEYTKSLVRRVSDSKFTGFGDDVDAYIKEGTRRFGLPEDVFRGFIKMEAGWTGKMSPTGAIGTGQFIKKTWNDMAATEDGQAIGMTPIGARFRTASDPRYDKRVNTLATALLARDNAVILRKYGLPITGENLYMMHNIGPGIIPVMLGYAPSAATLKAMQQNGMTARQTPAQFLAWQKGNYAVHYAIANKGTKVTGEPIKMQEGVAVASPKPQQVAVAVPATPNSASPSANKLDRTIVRGKGKTLVEIS